MRPAGNRRWVLLIAIMFAAAAPVFSGTIELEWDPVPDANGYRVYYGQAPGEYTGVHDAGGSTAATVSGLADCTNYYLAVKAYNHAGESAEFSNEISGWSRPAITSASPNAAMQGTQFTLSVNGANFQPGATVEVDNPYVFLDSPAVLSCSELQVAATVEPTAAHVRPAEVGRFSLTVSNPDDVYGTKSSVFEVMIDPARFDVDKREGPSLGRLDGRDTIWLSRLFGGREGDPLYDPDSDFNGDGWVDGQDLAHLASNMGGCWDGAAWNLHACPESLR